MGQAKLVYANENGLDTWEDEDGVQYDIALTDETALEAIINGNFGIAPGVEEVDAWDLSFELQQALIVHYGLTGDELDNLAIYTAEGVVV